MLYKILTLVTLVGNTVVSAGAESVNTWSDSRGSLGINIDVVVHLGVAFSVAADVVSRASSHDAGSYGVLGVVGEGANDQSQKGSSDQSLRSHFVFLGKCSKNG